MYGMRCLYMENRIDVKEAHADFSRRGSSRGMSYTVVANAYDALLAFNAENFDCIIIVSDGKDLGDDCLDALELFRVIHADLGYEDVSVVHVVRMYIRECKDEFSISARKKAKMNGRPLLYEEPYLSQRTNNLRENFCEFMVESAEEFEKLVADLLVLSSHSSSNDALPAITQSVYREQSARGTALPKASNVEHSHEQWSTTNTTHQRQTMWFSVDHRSEDYRIYPAYPQKDRGSPENYILRKREPWAAESSLESESFQNVGHWESARIASFVRPTRPTAWKPSYEPSRASYAEEDQEIRKDLLRVVSDLGPPREYPLMHSSQSDPMLAAPTMYSNSSSGGGTDQCEAWLLLREDEEAFVGYEFPAKNATHDTSVSTPSRKNGGWSSLSPPGGERARNLHSSDPRSYPALRAPSREKAPKIFSPNFAPAGATFRGIVSPGDAIAQESLEQTDPCERWVRACAVPAEECSSFECDAEHGRSSSSSTTSTTSTTDPSRMNDTSSEGGFDPSRLDRNCNHYLALSEEYAGPLSDEDARSNSKWRGRLQSTTPPTAAVAVAVDGVQIYHDARNGAGTCVNKSMSVGMEMGVGMFMSDDSGWHELDLDLADFSEDSLSLLLASDHSHDPSSALH